MKTELKHKPGSLLAIIQSDARVFGIKFAAARAAKRGVNVSITRLALFGKY